MTPEATAGESLDLLVGPWHILQLQRGHRFSTDDLVTAWMAWRARPSATRLLDLGSGIGSVGLCTLYKVSDGGQRADVHLTTVEAQALSVGLARRTVRFNGLVDRVTQHHADLREAPLTGSFDLITGSPPYFPEGTALVSAHPQKAGARIELRGSVFDYAAAAARWLAPGGRFAYVMSAADPRTEEAPIRAGLRVETRLDVVFAAGRAPQVAVLVCGHDGEVPEGRVTERLTVRGADGEWTEEYLRFRKLFAFTRPRPSEDPASR
jgi:tRNA1Val (adenine37-N6)-methyltransferase